MMRSCLFLTCKQLGHAIPDDHLLFEPMGKAGWQVKEVPWNAVDVDWKSHHCAVLRSTWDYTTHIEDFLQMTDQIEQSGCKLFNPPKIVRWNGRKTYLGDLASQGISVVPTQYKVSREQISEFFESFETETLVVKPIVGAKSSHIVLVHRNDPASYAKLPRNLQSDYFVQPFIGEIKRSGEMSMIFFGKRFSHAVLKKPSEMDFRTQAEYGAMISRCVPSQRQIEMAQEILNCVEEDLLYARVDVVPQDRGGFVLMELELIEPSLFLTYAPESVEHFVRTFSEMVAGTS